MRLTPPVVARLVARPALYRPGYLSYCYYHFLSPSHTRAQSLFAREAYHWLTADPWKTQFTNFSIYAVSLLLSGSTNNEEMTTKCVHLD